MNILFWLSTAKADRRGLCPIYTRITVNGKRAEFSTGIKVKSKDWDTNRKRVRGNSDSSILANSKLTAIKDKLDLIHLDRERKSLPITSRIIKDVYFNPIHSITILSIFDELIKEKEELATAKQCSSRTPEKWKNFQSHLTRFLTKTNQKNLLINELNLDIANKFLQYLKTDANLVHNSAIRCARTLKTVTNKAIEKELISVNKLVLWQLPNEKKAESKYIFLTDKELSNLENYQFTSEALQKIADLYIFQCYTGFGYADLKTFVFEEHTFPYEGQIYISKERFKTGQTCLIPLFPKALDILKKYQMELPKPTGKTEIISNAKYNKRIKEVAEIVGIKKHLTTHTARVTAGMKWLNSGIGLDEVARMLGDNPETVRKHYAYILPGTIHRATEKLRQ